MPDHVSRPDQSDASWDADRFERLIEPLLGDAYALALALSGDRSTAEDALQGAAMKAWEKLDHLREERSVRRWFLTIVVNECRSSWRKRVLRATEAERSAADDGWPRGLDERMDVRSAMAKLKSDDRVVLSLRFLLDLSVEEAAAVLGISASAVKARTARAAARFRRLLSTDPGAL